MEMFKTKQNKKDGVIKIGDGLDLEDQRWKAYPLVYHDHLSSLSQV